MSEHSVSPKKSSPFLDHQHFRIAFLLLAITGIVAILLGVVNGLTKDKIASIAEEKATAARKAVLSEAAEFEDLGYAEGTVLSAYKALDAEGNLIGFAIETGANGFGGAVDQIVGVKAASIGESVYQLSVSDVAILDISDETPGVGSKVSNTSFLSQFAGMTAETLASDFDAVSGASYSSEGVRAGVEAALALAENIIEQSGGSVK